MSTYSVKSERILSLDVFRGLTMALMVLVNSQGTHFPYAILEHAEWNGCTLADIVFPAFLFIVGMTTVISLRRHANEEHKAELYYSIFKRSLLLFLIGMFINLFPAKYIYNLRFYGILQRIAICYLVCAFLYRQTSVRLQVIVFIGILIGYWYFLTQIPLPGMVLDQISETSNWPRYVDRLLFSQAHLLGASDPEGILSTIPAVATTLSGLLAGSFLLNKMSRSRKCMLMIAVGLLFMSLGWVWSYNFPFNKNLWTSSFVLWTSGVSLIVFGLCFFIIDILGYSRWSLPFKILGMNALFIFVFHVLLIKIQSFFIVTLPNGTHDFLRAAIADYLFSNFSSPNAGLIYSLAFLFLNFLVAAFLYWRKIFIKI